MLASVLFFGSNWITCNRLVVIFYSEVSQTDPGGWGLGVEAWGAGSVDNLFHPPSEPKQNRRTVAGVKVIWPQRIVCLQDLLERLWSGNLQPLISWAFTLLSVCEKLPCSIDQLWQAASPANGGREESAMKRAVFGNSDCTWHLLHTNKPSGSEVDFPALEEMVERKETWRESLQAWMEYFTLL